MANTFDEISSNIEMAQKLRYVKCSFCKQGFMTDSDSNSTQDKPNEAICDLCWSDLEFELDL